MTREKLSRLRGSAFNIALKSIELVVEIIDAPVGNNPYAVGGDANTVRVEISK